MVNRIYLIVLLLLGTFEIRAQKLDLAPAVRQPEAIIAPESNEAELALQIIQVPEDMEVNLWAAEPMLVNPVAIDVDERGRVFVSETHRYGTSTLDIRDYMGMLELDLASRTIEDRIELIDHVFEEEANDFELESEIVRILEDTDGDGKADFTAPFASGFNSKLSGVASGVLARNGKVWFSNIPSLWLLEEGDTKGKAHKRTELLRGFGVHFGFTGHDLHGLIFGPDGKLYFSIGDRGSHLSSKEGNRIDLPNEGAVFRCDPDGSNLEVFATGLRNPQELAFDEHGNLFTFDNDCDNGDSERLVYLVEGGDSGWRIGYQYAPLGKAGPWMLEKMWMPRHEGQPEYILPPLANIEDGPSGVAYYPGTGLHPRYKGHYFVCHFRGSLASSGIYTYTLKENGASFEQDEKKLFLKGIMPTDLSFAPDGKLYISDWTPGWPKSTKGRIYTVGNEATLTSHLVKETRAFIEKGMHGRSTRELLQLLEHPDWRVRLEAQFELVRQNADPEILHQFASSGDADSLNRLHATWALGQMANNNRNAAKFILDLAHSDSTEVKAQAIKLLGDHKIQGGFDTLLSALDDRSDRVKFFAAQSLGKLGSQEAADELVDLLLINNDRDVYLRHAAIMGLVGSGNMEALAKASRSNFRSVRLGALLAYRRLESPRVASFLNDPDPSLIKEAARAIIGANLSKALGPLAALITNEIAYDHMLGLRILDAHFRQGTPGNAKSLTTFAADAKAPDALRVEALQHLSAWGNPPLRDRLIGTYRPLPDRSVDPAKRELTNVFDQLLAATEAVQAKAIQTASELSMSSVSDKLFKLFGREGTSTAVRISILDTLSKFNDPRVENLARSANESQDERLRLATLPVMAKLSPDASAPMLKRLVETGSWKEQQAAFKALGSMSHPLAIQTLAQSLKLLMDGQLSPQAQLELLEAAEAVDHPDVNRILEEYKHQFAKNPDPLARFEFALWGGDPNPGRGVFENNKITPCLRCHVVDGPYTGEPGPSLMGIAARHDRKYLLESIIKPSTQIANGFEMAIIASKKGDTVVGLVTGESDSDINLKLTDGNTQSVAKSDIASRQTAPSSMPEIFAQSLKRSELRDLIAYLATLTPDAVKAADAIEGF